MDTNDSGEFSFTADETDDRRRLDAVVVRYLIACSRTKAAGLIRAGFIVLNRCEAKPSQLVCPGDEIRGRIPPPTPIEITPEPIELNVIYRDEAVLVINKPPGLVIHPAPGHMTGTLVHGLLYHFPNHFSVGGQLRPGIVHRLDKDTSGCLVIAFNDQAHENLSRQFKARAIFKEYLALVHGNPKADRGCIDQPIGRHPVKRKKMSVAGRQARSAHTRWRVVTYFSFATLLRVFLKTGRTHQIRVHLSAAGHAVVGDAVYGHKKTTRFLEIKTGVKWPIKRQMLHARRLGFRHPITGDKLLFSAPLHDDMNQLLRSLQQAPKS